MQEITGGSKGRERQSILEVKMSTENNNLDELTVTETSPEMTRRSNPTTYVVHSSGRRDKRNKFQHMRNATRSEISLGWKDWSRCRIIHSCFMNSLLSLGAENRKNVGGHKHKVSAEHVIYLTCSTWPDRLVKRKRQKHMIRRTAQK